MTSLTFRVGRVEFKDQDNVVGHSDMTLEEAVEARETTSCAVARFWLGALVAAKQGRPVFRGDGDAG